ncbi:vacuolar protein sorting-associated protein 37A-like [Octopus sinensis]|uniref:Vacuolar protein sorting-associated protein 37A-like n=1 Tax=Octopus sinensis TaxID=2607531 RepID=A0A6P7TS98_9MOLL|nr:vacuolar protein sorting-associated protein 37A-like [Octopus sinensis]
MNWLLGGKTKAVSTTNLQAQKNKQIESLKKVNPKIQEVFRDVEYHVSFVSGSTNVCLRVSLPPQFPQEKPVVTIQPPAKHPWVDSQSKVVGCSSLNEFTMHSNLGLVIQSIIEEFNKNPPILKPASSLQEACKDLNIEENAYGGLLDDLPAGIFTRYLTARSCSKMHLPRTSPSMIEQYACSSTNAGKIKALGYG